MSEHNLAWQSGYKLPAISAALASPPLWQDSIAFLCHGGCPSLMKLISGKASTVVLWTSDHVPTSHPNSEITGCSGLCPPRRILHNDTM